MTNTDRILIGLGVLLLIVIVFVGVASAQSSKKSNTNLNPNQNLGGPNNVPKQFWGLPGLNCPNDTDTDTNGNRCLPNCNNGCMEGVIGKDCNGNPSTWC